MKKVVGLSAILMLTAAMAFSQTALTIVPDASVHNGAAAGAAEGFIDGSGNLDVSGMADGSLICFNINLANPNFTMGGYQFEIHYPANLTALSENDADWDGNTGAVYIPGGYITGSFQMLPATNLGNRTAGTVDNPAGTVAVGLLWTVPADRPGNDAGGTIGRLCLTLNPSAQASCDSAGETIRVIAGTEIFADENATAAFTMGANASVTFGNPSAYIRSDFNGDGIRTAADALGAARACLFGCSVAGSIDYCADLPRYHQVFDYNCSGSATPADALGAARLALGIANRRSSAKKADFMTVTESGELSLEYGKAQGAMVTATLKTVGMNVKDLYIDEDAKKNGWSLIFKTEGTLVTYGLMNPGTSTDLRFPAVKMSYDLTDKEGGIGVLETLNQKTDYVEFAAAPKLFMLGGAQNVDK